MTSTKPLIGIIGAMPEEIKKIQENTTDHKVHTFNKYISFTEAKLGDQPIIFAASNVGMVFAASVATTLITHFKCKKIIFTGVCGGIRENVEIGDIIIADHLINYDMNCTNFYLPHDPDYRHKIGEIPFLGLREFKCCKKLLNLAISAPLEEKINRHVGGIVTGSEFLSQKRKIELSHIWKECNDPFGVEMEGAGVAQICHAFDIPFLVLRAVSDNLKGDASKDFHQFCQFAADNLWHIVQHVIENIHE